ncbi:L domain-like protein [Hesseltinella vesiculosa]|uniref:L domain-like protein n=1 Tax=Hesseltinella vesiculosa TaxID=101127 RepID=A0A1X2GVN6_9FUNG|nr:L domain-like protein [Hesseltinella vesiculosa]
MGQTHSKRQQEIFAWVEGPSTGQSKIDNTSSEQSEPTRLLLFPHEYGLQGNRPSQSVCSLSSSFSSLASTSQPTTPVDLGRTDSGYATLSLEDPLVKDIDYVNHLYYAQPSASRTNSPPPPSSPPSLPSRALADIHTPSPYTFADVLEGHKPSRTEELYLIQRSLIELSPNLVQLTSLRTLVLTNNKLKTLPEALGKLQMLEELCISENQLDHLPASLQHLHQLKNLDVSGNQLSTVDLTVLPTSLTLLNLARNPLVTLGPNIVRLRELAYLDLSHTHLVALPAEITLLTLLRRIKLEHCPDLGHTEKYPLAHDPPSLLELCARQCVSALATAPPNPDRRLAQLPNSLLHYLTLAKPCSACHQPYFDSFVQRGRLLQKNPHMDIPLEYRLCNVHWTHDQDRHLYLFSQPCRTPIQLDRALTQLGDLITS